MKFIEFVIAILFFFIGLTAGATKPPVVIPVPPPPPVVKSNGVDFERGFTKGFSLGLAQPGKILCTPIPPPPPRR